MLLYNVSMAGKILPAVMSVPIHVITLLYGLPCSFGINDSFEIYVRNIPFIYLNLFTSMCQPFNFFKFIPNASMAFSFDETLFSID